MGYCFRPPEPGAEGWGRPAPRAATVVLVGCGGTGGFLAEALGRLLLGRDAELALVDPDRVEEANLGRQAFAAGDLGRWKAEVLAERLARRFGRAVGYAVAPYDADLHGELFGAPSRLRLLIGAVDNAAARRALARTLRPDGGVTWVDCGNGRNGGQVLWGNAPRRDELRGAFDGAAGTCRALPAPSLQRPELLEGPPVPPPAADCAVAVARAEQGPTINQFVAAVAAQVVEQLLEGRCRWMGAYFDLDDGTLRCVPAEPRTVAGLVGLATRTVCPPPRPTRGRAEVPADDPVAAGGGQR
jgi:PRTRC genetic system ThiF family protein